MIFSAVISAARAAIRAYTHLYAIRNYRSAERNARPRRQSVKIIAVVVCCTRRATAKPLEREKKIIITTAITSNKTIMVQLRGRAAALEKNINRRVFKTTYIALFTILRPRDARSEMFSLGTGDFTDDILVTLRSIYVFYPKVFVGTVFRYDFRG